MANMSRASNRGNCIVRGGTVRRNGRTVSLFGAARTESVLRALESGANDGLNSSGELSHMFGDNECRKCGHDSIMWTYFWVRSLVSGPMARSWP